MNELIKLLDFVPIENSVRIFIEFLIILIIINSIILKLFNLLEHWRKKRNQEEDEKELILDIREIKDNIDLACDCLKVVLADNLNRKCKYYWNMGYIPEDEFDEFVKEHEAYSKLHGNSTIDIKFDKIIETLKIKTPEEILLPTKDAKKD